MSRQESDEWTQDRIDMIRLALDRRWIKPGQAARALGLHRATVHNCMADGRLTWTRLGGSRLRSVRSVDVLRLVLAEMEQDGEGCLPELIEHVRSVVEDVRRSPLGEQPAERRTVGRTSNGPANGEHQANGEWRMANSRPNGEQSGERRTLVIEQPGEQPAIERRTANSPANGEQSG